MAQSPLSISRYVNFGILMFKQLYAKFFFLNKNKNKKIMQGYIVGNGVTDDRFDGNALVPFAHGMGLISDNIFEVGENN
jgi:hypothetical protein